MGYYRKYPNGNVSLNWQSSHFNRIDEGSPPDSNDNTEVRTGSYVDTFNVESPPEFDGGIYKIKVKFNALTDFDQRSSAKIKMNLQVDGTWLGQQTWTGVDGWCTKWYGSDDTVFIGEVDVKIKFIAECSGSIASVVLRSVIVDFYYLDAPTNLQGGPDPYTTWDSEYYLSWDAVPDATHYMIYYREPTYVPEWTQYTANPITTTYGIITKYPSYGHSNWEFRVRALKIYIIWPAVGLPSDITCEARLPPPHPKFLSNHFYEMDILEEQCNECPHYYSCDADITVKYEHYELCDRIDFWVTTDNWTTCDTRFMHYYYTDYNPDGETKFNYYNDTWGGIEERNLCVRMRPYNQYGYGPFDSTGGCTGYVCHLYCRKYWECGCDAEFCHWIKGEGYV